MKHVLAFLILILVACNDDDGNDIIRQEPFLFQDSFETQNGTLDELFPSDGSRWTQLQQSNPTGTTNEISITDNPVSDGNNALRILANASNDVLSKMDIEKGGFEAYAGSMVTISADFYIATVEPINDLFLIDLECCSCWDSEVDLEPSSDGDNQCPGVRLKMTGDRFLSIERGKIAGTTFVQTQTAIPRNQWFCIEWSMQLSDQTDGTNTLKINGTEVISAAGMNMPNAEVFRDIFAQNNIDFTLQEPVFYERIQVGATANPSAGTTELFVDNFILSIE